MQIKWIYAVIVLIVLSMVGLIFIQIKWVNQSYLAKEERFDQGIYHALNEVAENVERSEAYNYFEQIGVNDFRSSVRRMYDTVQVLKANYPNFALVDSSGENAVKFAFNDTSGAFVSRFMGSVTYLQEKAEVLHQGQGDLGSTVKDPSREKQIVERQFKKYNRLFQDLAVQFMLEDKCLKEKVNDSILKNTLQATFRTHGIDLPFQFAIFDNWSDGMLYGDLNIKKTESENYYSIPLFPNDFFENSGILIVNFPTKENFILQSMWLMLTSSFAFILLIILAFGIVFYIIFRQKKVDELKTDFINNMTHEFKTPVATISLASQMLKNERVVNSPEKILNYAHIIEEENKRLSGHIENVLTAARLDKGEFQLKKREINLNELLEGICDSLELRMQNEDGRLETRFQATRPVVMADEFHITNAFFNILDNAIKYRRDEHLVIQVSTENDRKGVKVTISDNGLGISVENQKMIFEKFYRVPTGNIHNVKGFGLGLSYVRIILEAHSGTIQVKSTPGKGSVFTLWLPSPI